VVNLEMLWEDSRIVDFVRYPFKNCLHIFCAHLIKMSEIIISPAPSINTDILCSDLDKSIIHDN